MNDNDWEQLNEQIREESQDVNSPWFYMAEDERKLKESKNKYTKTLPCGCVKDTLNDGTISFCAKHQEEHNIWLERQKLDCM